MSWGINPNEPEHEKIFTEFADFIGGLNVCGNIDYNEYISIFDEAREMFEKTYEQGKSDAIEKADKYRWHDLRKNHDDLPEIDKRLYLALRVGDDISYICGEYVCMADGEMHFEDDDFTRLKNVIAWREIEPFEEG